MHPSVQHAVESHDNQLLFKMHGISKDNGMREKNFIVYDFHFSRFMTDFSIFSVLSVHASDTSERKRIKKIEMKKLLERVLQQKS